MKIVRLEVVVVVLAVTTRMQAALSRHNYQHSNRLVKARSVRNIQFSCLSNIPLHDISPYFIFCPDHAFLVNEADRMMFSDVMVYVR